MNAGRTLDIVCPCVRCFSPSIVSLVSRIVVSALLLGARPAVARPLTLHMAAGSGPIRTSVRPSTLSTVFFITVLGLVPTVIGTTVTDTIVDSLPGVQSRNLHGVPALRQLSAPSPPQLAPLSRRALQTVPLSDTDRQPNDLSVHPQLASSPPQQLGSQLTPHSRRALQTMPSSDTDRQLSDLSVHSQLASSPPQQLGSSQLDSSPSPQLSSSPSPQLSSSPSPQLSSSPPLPQPQSGVHPHHDDEWANLPWLHPGLYTCIVLYALMWGMWLGRLFYLPTRQLTHSAPISTQLAVAWYFLLNCALAPIQWVTRPCLNTWAPKAAVADFHDESEVPTTHQRDPLVDMTSLELANVCKSNRRPRRVPSVRTTPVDHRSRRSVSSARSSSTPSTCSSGPDGKCTANRPASTRVDLLAAAILRQLDECELLSLQGVSPSRFADIHKLSMGGARAITRRAHLIVPQNADLQFMCRNAPYIVATCGPSRRARHQMRVDASSTAGDPTPPSTVLVRP